MSYNIRDTIKSMRKGDKLPVRDLRQLGRKLTDVLKLLDEIHAKGCYVVQTTTGKRSDRNGVALVADNLHLLNKGAARRIASANGSKGGRRKEYHANAEDRAKWKDVVAYATDAEAAQAIGRSVSTLRRTYKRSGRAKTGRPRKGK